MDSHAHVHALTGALRDLVEPAAAVNSRAGLRLHRPAGTLYLDFGRRSAKAPFSIQLLHHFGTLRNKLYTIRFKNIISNRTF